MKTPDKFIELFANEMIQKTSLEIKDNAVFASTKKSQNVAV